jgi:hypothetical protein
MAARDTNYVENYVLNGQIPWVFNPTQTPLIEEEYLIKGAGSSFFWAHNLRNFDPALDPEGQGHGSNTLSNEYQFFYRKFVEWHQQQDIPFNHVYRACINLSVLGTADPVKFSVPHVDHFFPHKVWIWYLDTVDHAETVLFDQQLEIIDSVKCVKNTAVSFDGLTRHAQRYPTLGVVRRVVVFTYR